MQVALLLSVKFILLSFLLLKFQSELLGTWQWLVSQYWYLSNKISQLTLRLLPNYNLGSWFFRIQKLDSLFVPFVWYRPSGQRIVCHFLCFCLISSLRVRTEKEVYYNCFYDIERLLGFPLISFRYQFKYDKKRFNPFYFLITIKGAYYPTPPSTNWVSEKEASSSSF